MQTATTTDEELAAIDAYWRAANYLTVGQIYLRANPLLREPLRAEHIKPRLLGHWGTSPGLSLVYAHLNRLIRRHDLDVMFLAGPGHGGPAVVANVYLEGTYSEIYPDVTEDVHGMERLFCQFSTPGGIPSHVGPATPGSIHEGGELGYVLTHAFGAAFDNPDLIAVAVVGDGEAETAPLEGSWKGICFLNAARDGAVLPILHLNGYKIAGPTVLGRASDESIRSLLEGHGYAVHHVAGDDPMTVHRAFATTLETCLASIRSIQEAARMRGVRGTPPWPAIVLRTPKGWTGPKVVDGKPVEGTFRAHQVPLADVRENPAKLAMLEHWMRSYQPERLFDADGRLERDLKALVPAGTRRMGANPHANGGAGQPLVLPRFDDYAVAVPAPGTVRHESTRALGALLRDTYRDNPTSFRLMCPDETPDANCLLSVADHCLRSKNYVNLIIIDKQPELQWLDLAAAREHCARGASIWDWAGNHGDDPDVVLGCAGDTATLETLAAAAWLRVHAPELHVRVVNVVDLMKLFSPREHPHGMFDAAFVELFTGDVDVCFSFHGYAGAIHQLLHARPNAARFHVRGYKEEGTTTTPFDMVVLNETSRYHIAMDAIRRSRRQPPNAALLTGECLRALARHRSHVREHLEDLPEIRDWTWPAA